MWLLYSRSRSQQRVKMWVNQDDIYWTAGHFVTKLCMVMQHHEPECYAQNKIVCCLHGQGHSDQNMATVFSELLILWQPNWWNIIILECFVGKKMDHCIQGQGHSKGSKCHMFVQISSKLPNILSPNLVLWCRIVSRSVMQKVQGQIEGSYNQIWLFLQYLLNRWFFCTHI